MPFKVQGNTIPHLKDLRYGKYEKRGLSFGSTSSICQGILKSDNLLHKQGFVDSHRNMIKMTLSWFQERNSFFMMKFFNLLRTKKKLSAAKKANLIEIMRISGVKLTVLFQRF